MYFLKNDIKSSKLFLLEELRARIKTLIDWLQ